jgi:hypothetical protein
MITLKKIEKNYFTLIEKIKIIFEYSFYFFFKINFMKRCFYIKCVDFKVGFKDVVSYKVVE